LRMHDIVFWNKMLLEKLIDEMANGIGFTVKNTSINYLYFDSNRPFAKTSDIFLEQPLGLRIKV